MANMINEPLVSLIVPCYNMSLKITRLLESLLSQTYKKLEIIFIDDGSTDNLFEILSAYENKFKCCGFRIVYHKKSNGGLGSAINAGLKLISGEFVCWPDADDYLTPDSVEKKIQFLLQHNDYGFVRSDAAIFHINNLKKRIGRISSKSTRYKETGLMLNCLAEDDFPYCPGCHMVRVSALKKVNPNMDIFEAPRAQNIQLLLPLLYRFRFGYINECLYNYIIYDDSMSRGDDNYQKCLSRSEGLLDVKLQTLRRISFEGDDYQYYYNYTMQYYYHKRCIDALAYGVREDYCLFYPKITNKHFLILVDKYELYIKHPKTRHLWLLTKPTILLEEIKKRILI